MSVRATNTSAASARTARARLQTVLQFGVPTCSTPGHSARMTMKGVSSAWYRPRALKQPPSLSRRCTGGRSARFKTLVAWEKPFLAGCRAKKRRACLRARPFPKRLSGEAARHAAMRLTSASNFSSTMRAGWCRAILDHRFQKLADRCPRMCCRCRCPFESITAERFRRSVRIVLSSVMDSVWIGALAGMSVSEL